MAVALYVDFVGVVTLLRMAEDTIMGVSSRDTNASSVVDDLLWMMVLLE
ncbi:MAG: hypothetical protein QME47_06980 [Candidatus Thermoplasmatota archaeon]|nr:hypothetical protein [Candidatus Thermoplasmatota archaeon]